MQIQYYAHLYYITIFASIFLGTVVLRKQKDASWYYFFLFSIFASLWFLGYFLFFSGVFSEQILLFISRFTFLVGILWVYSLLSFIIFFEKRRAPIPYHLMMGGLYGVLALLYVTSPYIIETLDFDTVLSVFREREWSLFFLHVWLHASFVLLFLLFSYRWIRNLTWLHRVRLQHILFATFIFILTLLFLQLILPMFHIWILEREIVFFFFWYILYISFVLRRYYFHPLGYSIRRILIFISAAILTVGMCDISRNTLFPSAPEGGLYSYIDSTYLIILFASFWFLLTRYFLARDIDEDFKEGLASVEDRLAPIVEFSVFSETLKKLFCQTFTIEARIVLVAEHEEIRHFIEYFSLPSSHQFYINDIAFQNKNPTVIDPKKSKKILSLSSLSLGKMAAYEFSNLVQNHSEIFIQKKRWRSW